MVRPDGQVLLYEHVRPTNPLLGKLTDLLSPYTRRLFGPVPNRAQTAGLRLVEVHRREIVAVTDRG